MKKVVIVIFLVLSSISLFSVWQEIPQNSDQNSFQFESENLSETVIDFSLTGYETEEIYEQGVNFVKLSHPEAGDLVDIGKPDLPIFSKLIAIPNNGNVSFELLDYDMEVIENINIYPRQELMKDGQTERLTFSMDQSFYYTDTQYPNAIVNLGEPVIMRDLRLVNLTINPFQYNPATKKLTVYKNIEVAVNTDNATGKNPLEFNGKKSRFFEPLYESLVLNYEATSTRDADYQQPSYLFIYPDDDDVEENLELLADWKHQKGFDVTTVSTATTGSNLSQIKDYIQNAYDNWDIPPEFVCIVGDANGSYYIPTGTQSNGIGDQYYVLLEGDDILADAFVGRLAFNSMLEFQTILSKILNYEKMPYMGSTDWYDQGLLVGDPSHSGPSTITTCKYTKHVMQNHNPNYTFEEYYNGNYVSGIANGINDGVSFFNYRGYIGMSNWDNSNTSDLNNGFMLPVVVIITCSTGNFSSSYDDARTEYFTKAGSPTQPKGAIATIGTATSSTHTCFNNSVSSGIFDGIFVKDIYNMGGALVNGKLNLYMNYPGNPGNWVNKFSYWNNLMGDPGMEVWTGIPQNLEVVYDEYVATGTNYLEVFVEDGEGFPLENAWVTALKDNNGIFETGFTDENGMIYLELPDDETGEVKLTVTYHNHIPHLGSFYLQQEDNAVNIHSYDISDTNSDNLINPGETIDMNVSLKNYGTSIAEEVTATLTTDCEYINITAGTNTWGTMNPEQVMALNNAFSFTVAPEAIGNFQFQLDVTITDNADHQWQDHIMLQIDAPLLSVMDYSIIGGDNVLDPGETVNMEVIIQNYGNVTATNIDAILSTNDGRLTISDNTGNYANIMANGYGSNYSDRFTISANDDIIPGSIIPMIIELSSAEGLAQTGYFNIVIGTPAVTDPLGPDQYGYYAFDDGDTDYYNAPTYEWIEIDPNYDGNGTILPLQDSGNGGDRAFIDIPTDFHLQMYGETYDRLTICSNGWIAPGEQDTDNFMNWIVPGPMGPSPMIGVFWDDLKIGYNGAVCYEYQQESHRLIVEWSHLQNEYNNAEETFQVILYDSNFYPTTTNDNEFKMQYKVVNNVDQGDYGSYSVAHGQYATVGIEDETTTIGLQYTFNNTYPAAAKQLQNEMAILFTAPPIPSNGPYLYFNDLGINSGGDTEIAVGETAYLSPTIKNIGPDTAHNITVNLSLADEFVNLVDGNESYGDLDSNGEITINNAFIFEVSEDVPDGHIINILAVIACDEETWERNLNFSIVAEPDLYVNVNSFEVELGQDATTQTQMELTNVVTGSGNLHYQIRIEEPTGDRSLTGSSMTNNTYTFEPGTEVDWLFSVHNLSQDSEWMTDINIHFPYGTTVLSATNFSGGSGGDMVWNGAVGENVDLNWHGSTDLGYGYLHQNQIAQATVSVAIDEVFSGNILLEYELIGDGYGDAPHIIVDTLEIKYPLGWVSVNPHEGDLSGGESEVVNVTFDSDELELGAHLCNIIINDGSAYETTIPVTLNIIATESDDDVIPAITQLVGNYPNPFNPETQIAFSLHEPSNVELVIYNIKGEKVKTLADGYFEANNYNLRWKGYDDHGNKVASGIYFYQMTTDKYKASKKMILMK